MRKKIKRKTKRNDKKAFAVFSSFFKIFLIVGILAIFAAVGVGTGVLYGWIDSAEELKIEEFKLDQTSFVYYTDSETGESVELERLYDDENRIWVSIKNIPDNLKYAFIAIEDQRFKEHNGVDFKRVGGAVLNYAKVKILHKGGDLYGGSTITQQLIKNLTGEKQQTIQRKIQEMWRAINLEKHLSKEQILEWYLNTIFLSERCNGVQSAANTYFGKDVSELTLAECASIAGITQYPTLYNPFLHPDKNKEKQETVLTKMFELGYIDEQQYKSAVNEKLNFKRSKQKERTSKQSYFVDQVIDDVLKDLKEKYGYSDIVANKMLYTGGLKIYSTIDPKVQKSIDKYFKDMKFFTDNPNLPKFKDNKVPECAMIVIDPYTGQVKGMVGGIGEKTANRTFNRATKAARQPGSSIKPVAVYAPAIEYDIVTLGTVIDDIPFILNKGQANEWMPRNWSYYSVPYWGLSTIRRAIVASMNSIAVQVLDKVGLENSYNFLTNNLGISTLVDRKNVNGKIVSDKVYPALALGGLTQGVYPIEMAAAYGTFVNKGIYKEPYTYTKVVDSSGNVILEKDNTNLDSHVAMSEQTAFLMTQALKGVVDSGTGTAARLKNGMPAAGKTGSATGNKDKWFVGYTPYYVGAVWYGFDQPKEINLGGKANPGAVIWGTVMNEIHEGMEAKNFVQPQGIIKTAICIDSGKKPTEICYKDKNYRGYYSPSSRVQMEYFKKGTEPTEFCDVHITAKVCTESWNLATEYCPPDKVEEKVFIVRPEPYIPIVDKNGKKLVPLDAKYELPAWEGEYCTIHGPSGNEIFLGDNDDSEAGISIEDYFNNDINEDNIDEDDTDEDSEE